MPRLLYDNALGQLGASLAATAGPDTINFGSTIPPFATLGNGDYIPLTLDPPISYKPSSTEEVVWLTSYTSGASTGTIKRGCENTSSAIHKNGGLWVCAPTIWDARTSLQPTGDPTGAMDVAMIKALISTFPTVVVNNGSSSATYNAGHVKLGPGIWYFGTTGGTSGDIGNVGPFVDFTGDGKDSTFIYYLGTGSAIRAYNAIAPADNTFDNMFSQAAAPYGLASRFGEFTLDGSLAGNGAVGLHLGDCEGGYIDPDTMVQHFNGTSSVGISLDNAVSWTESWKGGADTWDNTTHVLFTNTTGNAGEGSHGYCRLTFKIYMLGNQIGVSFFESGYSGSLTVGMNSAGTSAANTGIMFKFAGGSTIHNCHIDIQSESNSISPGGGTHYAQSMNFATATDGIFDSYGTIVFNGAAISNYPTEGIFQFDGQVVGDFNLNPIASYAGMGQGSSSYTAPFTTINAKRMGTKGAVSGQATATVNISLSSGDIFDIGNLSTGAGDPTIQFQDPATGPQHIWIRSRQSNGGGTGNYQNIIWPTTSPSPNVGSPNVTWENGIPPLCTRITAALDWFELWTQDGINWYGRQHANVGTEPTVGLADTVPVLPKPIFHGGNAVPAAFGASYTTNPAQTTVAGNTLVFVVGNESSGSTITPTITDSQSNTWVLDGHAGSTGANIWVFSCKNSAHSLSTSDTITVTWSGTPYPAATSWLYELPLGSSVGLDLVGTSDSVTSSVASQRVSLPSGSELSNEIAIAGCVAGDGGSSRPTWSVSGSAEAPMGPWTLQVGQQFAGNTYGAVTFWRYLLQPGSVPTCIFTPSSSEEMAAIIVAYHS